MYLLEWQRIVAASVGLLLVAVAVAVVVLRPGAPANRRLGILLATEGVALISGWALAQMALDIDHAAFWTAVAWAAYGALVPLYLLFLATLKTPVVRPLANRPATVALWSLAVLAPLAVMARPEWFFEGFVARQGQPTFVHTPGPVAEVLPAINSLPLPLFALLAAIHQWRRAAHKDLFRRQAAAYALAFGWRDLSWIFILFVLPALTGTSVTDSHTTPTLAYALLSVVFMLLLVYGILSAQLFDIDVKARFLIGQSTFAALAAGAFFLVKEAAENVADADGLLPTLAIAAGVALAFRPLQAIGRRVAAGLLPVRAPSEESQHRLQIYQVALAGFLEDGKLTERAAATLQQMRQRLALSEADVEHLHASGPAPAPA